VAFACLCAAGTTRPPRGDSLSRIARQLRDSDPFVATLAGARIEVGSTEITLMRDAGEIARGGLAPVTLESGRAAVWDGRFELQAAGPGLTVRPLAGLAAKLPESQRRRLSTLPAAARPTLPVLVDAEGNLSCPILAGASPVRVRALAMARFEAAVGRVDREPAP
jgi:tRNA(Ile)-lysidine synthase